MLRLKASQDAVVNRCEVGDLKLFAIQIDVSWADAYNHEPGELIMKQFGLAADGL